MYNPSIGSNPPRTVPGVAELILTAPQLFIKQQKNWWELLTSWETLNKYQIYSSSGTLLGAIIERGGGFLAVLKRIFLRTHRPFAVDVLDVNNQQALHLSRDFFWFFSDIKIATSDGRVLGSAHRRFAFFHKSYDLKDSSGNTFAQISSPFWRIWTFTIKNDLGQELAKVTKKWGGMLREGFTNADTFQIDFGSHRWQSHERAVIFATAISIDFDYFENSGGGMSRLLNNG